MNDTTKIEKEVSDISMEIENIMLEFVKKYRKDLEMPIVMGKLSDIIAQSISSILFVLLETKDSEHINKIIDNISENIKVTYDILNFTVSNMEEFREFQMKSQQVNDANSE